MGKKKNYVLGTLVGFGLAIVVSAVVFIIIQPMMASKERVYLYAHCMCSHDRSKFAEFTQQESSFSHVEYDEDIVLKNVEQVRKTPINSEVEYTYESSYCRFYSKADRKNLTYYYADDCYIGSDKSRIRYIHGTDIIRVYSSDYSSGVEYPQKDKEEVIAIADEFIHTIYSDEMADKYVFSGFEGNRNWKHVVTYTRYVYGYATEERLEVHIDFDGTVENFYAWDIGEYDDWNISEDEVNQARLLLEEKISNVDINDLSIQNTRIITDEYGKAFIEIYAEYDYCGVWFSVSLMY